MHRSAAALSMLIMCSCSRAAPPTSADTAKSENAPPVLTASVVVPTGASICSRATGPTCFRFSTPEDAFRWVLAEEPRILAIGEAHAQKGMEGVASSTKRFTELLLPILTPRAKDIVLELWAPNPKCMKEVSEVASAQKPVTEVQAATNQNEFVVLGTKAKALGMTPWLLRPTCDDFARIADAGADDVDAMLRLVRRLTQEKLSQLYARHRVDADTEGEIVVAYGGALHNDLAPTDETKAYSFGPELDRFTGGQYIELDLIVPEYIKKTPVWEKLPWYASFEAERASGQPQDGARLYVVGERSFVLVFPATKDTR